MGRALTLNHPPSPAPTRSPSFQPGPPAPRGQGAHRAGGGGCCAVPARRGWHGPHGFLESPVSHPQPPAQPFSCLPSPLAASQPPYSAPGPLGEAAAEPSRYRAPSLTRGRAGGGDGSRPREVPSARPPCALTPPHPAGGMLRPGRPSAPRLVPPDPGSDPQHETAPALPWLHPESPLPWPAGSRGLSGRSLPLPTHTYARPAPAERQAGA